MARMSMALRKPVDLADYLAAEEQSPLRNEYVGGYVHAMTGGTLRHNRIALNLASGLMARLEGGPCQVFINDVKLHVQAADSVYYPDVFVHCGPGPAGSAKVLSDATLIVEVLSDSTAMTDRREKRMAYQRLRSLRAYWILSQDEQRAEVHLRDEHGAWGLHSCEPGDSLPMQGLSAVPLLLSMAYAGTDLA
jgi:Uma2 family endonuclease